MWQFAALGYRGKFIVGEYQGSYPNNLPETHRWAGLNNTLARDDYFSQKIL